MCSLNSTQDLLNSKQYEETIKMWMLFHNISDFQILKVVFKVNDRHKGHW